MPPIGLLLIALSNWWFVWVYILLFILVAIITSKKNYNQNTAVAESQVQQNEQIKPSCSFIFLNFLWGFLSLYVLMLAERGFLCDFFWKSMNYGCSDTAGINTAIATVCVIGWIFFTIIYYFIIRKHTADKYMWKLIWFAIIAILIIHPLIATPLINWQQGLR